MLRRKHVQLFVVSPLILGIIATVVSLYIQSWRSFESRVSATEQTARQASGGEPVVTAASPQFLSNEILIKVKRESKGKVKEGNPSDTGISAIDEIAKEKKIQRFEKVAKEGKKSKTDADIFQWYKLTFDEPAETIASDHPGAKRVEQVLQRLLKQSDIEAVEPNYIVSILQTPEISPADTPTSTPSAQPLPSPTETPPTIEPSPVLPSDTPMPPSATDSPPSPTPTAANVPNDPYYFSSGTWGQSYPDLWGLKKINSEGAWSQTTGSSSVVIAAVDTGVDRSHEDIAANMWVNSAETPGNGIDDDANGYIDDYYGWDFVNNDGEPNDDHGHGTHTAGTIAAIGNNGVGVVGVNWTAKIMAVKFLNSAGSGTLDNGAKALQYAADLGARISSNSWGCGCQSTLIDDAVAYEHDRGMVVVVAAGNSYADALDFSPASSERAITVSATDVNDVKASFSNGGEKLDVAAPGVDILSLKASVSPMCDTSRTVGTMYCRVSGTSMATPHVSGLTALLLLKNPSLSNEQIRQIIRLGATDLGSSGKDSSFGYGRIDASRTLAKSGENLLTPFIKSPRSRTLISGTNITVLGSVAGANFSRYALSIGAGRAPTSWVTLADSTTQVIDGTLATFDATAFADGSYTIRLTATDTAGATFIHEIFDLVVDHFEELIVFPRGFVGKGSYDIYGTAQTKNSMPFGSISLEWGQGTSPSSWSTIGITLAGGGVQPVVNGIIGQWDTSGLTTGQVYTLRLRVSSSDGKSEFILSSHTIDADIVASWPKLLPARGDGYDSVMPVIEDIDADGVKEIIVLETVSPGKIHVYDKGGRERPGFPVQLSGAYSPHWGVSVGDVDADGTKEIGVTSGYLMYLFDANGASKPGWPRQIFKSAGSTMTQDMNPVFADLNRDGRMELITMEVDSFNIATQTNVLKMHVLQWNGSYLPGFPKLHTFTNAPTYPLYYGSVSTADMDNDGFVEIAFGYGRNLYLMDNTGTILSGWPFTPAPSPDGHDFDPGFMSPAGFADVDGDGILEVVAVAQGINCFWCQTSLYAWEKDGSVLPNWPKPDTGRVYDSTTRFHVPAAVDIDADGKDEVAMGIDWLRLYKDSGLVFAESGQYSGSNGPAVADINGDGLFDFTSMYSRKVSIWNSQGQKVWERIFPYDGHNFNYSGVFADMENDGTMEFAAVQGPKFYSDTLSAIYLWRIPNASGNPTNHTWPMFMHDQGRASRIDRNPRPTPTLLPSGTPTPTFTPTVTPKKPQRPTATPTVAPPPGGDVSAPQVSITNPTDGSTVPIRTTVSIISLATDNLAVTKVEFFVNGTRQCTDATAPYVCLWKVPAKRNVAYQIKATAWDAAFNSASHTISVISQ